MTKNTTTEHSKNFEKVKNYYDRRLWGITRVRNAVTNPKSGPWITAEEFEEITGQPYKPDEE